ncbi:MAG: CBS domain-containing protein [Bacteroidales bacterium]|jgi:CBS domain containing-hemolysin-like protein|nr:CBS domain-containing protein [Bacteroidales bacterium]
MLAGIIILFVLGALGTLFFSGMKTALSVCDKLIFDIDIKNGSIRQGIVFRPKDNIHLCISLMLTGEIVSACMSGISMFYLLKVFALENPWLNLAVLSVMVFLFLILFKSIPSAVFAKNSNYYLRKFSFLANFMSDLIYPWLYIVLFLPVTHLAKKNGSKAFSQLLPDYTHQHEAEQKYRSNDFKILRNALDFTDIKIRECLVPRNEIVYADLSDSIETLTKKFVSSGFSKILICRNSVDNVAGYVNALKLFKNPKKIDGILTEVIEVPQTMTADKLFKLFIKKRLSVATVIDEYGGIAGMLTIEDIIEEITGEIEDEHDSQEFIEKQTAPNEYIFSGRLEIDYINEKYKINLPKSDEYETLAGYILKLNEDIPETGDEIKDGIFEMKILQVRKPKINIIRLKINKINS